MLKLREGIEVYISFEPIDMRKSIDSLIWLVKNDFNEHPQSGHLFLFFNKSKDKAKIKQRSFCGIEMVLCCITSAWKNIGFMCQNYRRPIR